MEKIGLLVFTCEGREHLLLKTLDSFLKQHSLEKFSEVILAIDGKFDLNELEHDIFTTIVHNKKQQGYVQNIENALKHLHAEYFIWLEDDWNFHDQIGTEFEIKLLKDNQKISQIALSKHSELPEDHFLDYYLNPYGFTANPCLCRTSFVKSSFEEFIEGKNQFNNFEEQLSHSSKIKEFINLLKHRQNSPRVEHTGYLESSDRRLHVRNPELLTLDKKPLLSKFKTLLRLWYALLIVSIKIFKKTEFHNLAFRITNSVKSTNKTKL